MSMNGGPTVTVGKYEGWADRHWLVGRVRRQTLFSMKGAPTDTLGESEGWADRHCW